MWHWKLQRFDDEFLTCPHLHLAIFLPNSPLVKRPTNSMFSFSIHSSSSSFSQCSRTNGKAVANRNTAISAAVAAGVTSHTASAVAQSDRSSCNSKKTSLNLTSDTSLLCQRSAMQLRHLLRHRELYSLNGRHSLQGECQSKTTLNSASDVTLKVSHNMMHQVDHLLNGIAIADGSSPTVTIVGQGFVNSNNIRVYLIPNAAVTNEVDYQYCTEREHNCVIDMPQSRCIFTESLALICELISALLFRSSHDINRATESRCSSQSICNPFSTYVVGTYQSANQITFQPNPGTAVFGVNSYRVDYSVEVVLGIDHEQDGTTIRI